MIKRYTAIIILFLGSIPVDTFAADYDFWTEQSDDVITYIVINRTSQKAIALRHTPEDELIVVPADLTQDSVAKLTDGFPKASYVAFDMDGDIRFVSHRPELKEMTIMTLNKKGRPIHISSFLSRHGIDTPLSLSTGNKVTVTFDRYFTNNRLELNFVDIDADHPMAGKYGTLRLDMIDSPSTPAWSVAHRVDRNVTADELPVLTFYTDRNMKTKEITRTVLHLEGLSDIQTIYMLQSLKNLPQGAAVELLP
ncbi:MAG: hypothetical protein ACWA5L_04895 [bacterium]